MFCYYESGRGTWAVRNDGGVLMARFATKADALHYMAQFEADDVTQRPPDATA